MEEGLYSPQNPIIDQADLRKTEERRQRRSMVRQVECRVNPWQVQYGTRRYFEDVLFSWNLVMIELRTDRDVTSLIARADSSFTIEGPAVERSSQIGAYFVR